MKFIGQIFTKITRKQSAEFGQVAVLVSILFAIYYRNWHLATVSFWILLLTILIPGIFYPLAVIWFGLSKILSKISSLFILNLVFLFLVIPVGLFRKMIGIDNLKLKKFKKNRDSVMTERNHLYEANDLVNTF
jgi:fatty acid desaturase